jgi:IMP dehydrogenase/GMP reductase
MRDAITFDDVLLVPAYNHYESRKVVDIDMTDKTGRLSLKLPLMTANMDTTTEAENEIIADIAGGLRSGLTYGGAANIRELQRKLDYIQISWAGQIEGMAHKNLDQEKLT